MLDWIEIASHVNIDRADTTHAVELTFFAEAAERLIATHPDLRPEFLPLDLADPLLKLAVLELVRDMWQGSQAGAGGQRFGQDYVADGPQFTAGRPELPPYVRGLLRTYLRSAATTGPVGTFPASPAWPL